MYCSCALRLILFEENELLRLIYSALLWLLLPFALLRLLWRSRQDARYRRRWSERFGRVPHRPDGDLIWVHAVSVGEVLAAEALIDALRAAYPAHRFYVTTTTPTGSALVEQRFGTSVAHSYLPFDLGGCVNRFLDRLRPSLALVMETELWPNLFHACCARGVELALINARLSDRSYRRYRRWPGLTAAALRSVSGLGAQSDADAERFVRLGAVPARVQVTGNLKFDRTPPASSHEAAQQWRSRWGASRPVWVAGSVHEGERRPVMAAFAALRADRPDLFLCLAPRHPERAGAWAAESRALGLKLCTSSTAPAQFDDCSLLLVDVLGMLDTFYQAADAAFVGGSLVPHGGQNPIEALAAGVPVAHGPHVWNFAELYAALDRAGAAREVADATGLARVIGGWLDDPASKARAVEAGRDVLNARSGAVERTVRMIGALGCLK